MKKAKAPKDPDYRAAWRACKKPWISWSVVDLRKRLKQVLRSGWSIQALKAYAFVYWRHKRCDHVTEELGAGLWHSLMMAHMTRHCSVLLWAVATY